MERDETKAKAKRGRKPKAASEKFALWSVYLPPEVEAALAAKAGDYTREAIRRGDVEGVIRPSERSRLIVRVLREALGVPETES